MLRFTWKPARVAWMLCLAATVCLSASCGCSGGGGSAGPPSPVPASRDDHHQQYSDNYYPHNYYYNSNLDHQLSHRRGGSRSCQRADNRADYRVRRAELLRERWLPGAGYLVEADHARVEKGAAFASGWASLAFFPDCDPQSAPDQAGVASVIYSLGTSDLGTGEVHLELTWERNLDSNQDCWIGVFRPGQAADAWNWFKPEDQRRVALTPLSQYQLPTTDKRVFVAVVVTGRQLVALRKVALREYGYPSALYDSPLASDADRTLALTPALRLEPACESGSPPETPGAAIATYALFADRSGDYPVYLELKWSGIPPAAGDCKIGVMCGDSTVDDPQQAVWNWFVPDTRMQIALNPFIQYQTAGADQPVYLRVVVTGCQPCWLSQIALRECCCAYD